MFFKTPFLKTIPVKEPYSVAEKCLIFEFFWEILVASVKNNNTAFSNTFSNRETKLIGTLAHTLAAFVLKDLSSSSNKNLFFVF